MRRTAADPAIHRKTVTQKALSAFLALICSAVSPSVGAAPKCTDLLTPESETLAPLVSINASAESLTAADLGMSKVAILEAFRGNPEYEWVYDDLLGERLSFAMNRNEKRRDFIAEKGFLNQFEAKRSTGTYDPRLRLEIEAAYSGMSIDAYRRVRVANRPKYGYLAPPPGSKIQRETQVQYYGDDIYLFKKQNLADRTTWVFGDSLDQAPLKEVKIPGSWESRTSAKPIPKAGRFLPWKDRGLMLPRLPAVKKGELPSHLELEDLSSNVELPNGKTLRYGAGELVMSYVELQFWKPLTLDDVEAFVFKGNPPSGKFLKELRKRKIAIYRYDAKKKIDVPWKP